MAIILKNTTASPILITDVGIELAASPAAYTVAPQEYLVWAASSDIITAIGVGDVVVNDGAADLTIAEGQRLIRYTVGLEVLHNGVSLEKIIKALDFITVGNVVTDGTGKATIHFERTSFREVTAYELPGGALRITTSELLLEEEPEYPLLATLSEEDLT